MAVRQRTLADAFADALPDALAAAACLLAWIDPHALGRFDLLAYAAPLFCIQLPLSILGVFGAVTRLEDRAMGRATKAGFVLAPSMAMAIFAPIALGLEAFIGVLWLSATTLFRIATGRVDRDAPVKGAWITFTEGVGADGRSSRSYGVDTDRVGSRGGRVRQWRVEAGHSQVMASLTASCGMVLAFLIAFIDVDRLGITPASEAASAWSQTVIGSAIGAHYALAAGVALFTGRMLMQFEGLAPRAGTPEAAPVPDVDDDPVLREIVRKVDGPDARARRGRDAGAP